MDKHKIASACMLTALICITITFFCKAGFFQQGRARLLSDTLRYATLHGDKHAVEELIKKGEDVDKVDSFGATALMHAVRIGNVEIIELLLDAGASVTASNQEGDTALHKAAKLHAANIAQKLLRAGANIDQTNQFGQTPLHIAAEGYNNPDLLQALLNAGANMELVDNAGRTPLIIAALNRNEKLVETLLRHGATLPTTELWASIESSGLRAGQIAAAKQLIQKIFKSEERAHLEREYFESEGMPPDITRLIRQIGVEGLPPEKERPIPEEN